MDTQSNKSVFITGVSSGIGKALAELLLEQGFRVHGIGRKNSLLHPNYSFHTLDLSDPEAVSDFRFPDTTAKSVVLVNNAGMIGQIAPAGELQPLDIRNTMQVNTVSPQILCNQFLSQYSAHTEQLHLLNISSGAGKRAIDAWSVYCSSKAALDLFSECIMQEAKQRNRTGVFVHSVAPGVVDTDMQAQIREASPEKFFASQRFHDLKQNGDLATPKQVAEKLFKLIGHPEKTEPVVISLADIQ